MPGDLRIGILAGGSSSEREISLRSGRAVKKALAACGISTAFLDPRDESRFQSALRRIDLAFIALHGSGGEDGVVQARLEKNKIPYVGSDPAGSRLAFDKLLAKKLFQKAGIPTPPYAVIRYPDWREKLSAFPVPFVIKPLREGSSVGVFIVEDLGRAAEKIRQSLREYGELLAEKKIEGREFTVGILGDKALPVIELVPKRSFYDYRAKYTKGLTEYRVPAPIPAALERRLRRLALRVHRTLGLRDFSRTDLMLDRGGNPYVLEANSIPGFTELSLVPKAALAAGISFENLCCRLVAMAHGRAKRNGMHPNGRKKP